MATACSRLAVRCLLVKETPLPARHPARTKATERGVIIAKKGKRHQSISPRLHVGRRGRRGGLMVRFCRRHGRRGPSCRWEGCRCTRRRHVGWGRHDWGRGHNDRSVGVSRVIWIGIGVGIRISGIVRIIGSIVRIAVERQTDANSDAPAGSGLILLVLAFLAKAPILRDAHACRLVYDKGWRRSGRFSRSFN